MTAARALLRIDPNAPNSPEVEAAFQAVPETMIAEVLGGVLYTTPLRGRAHANTASILGGELHDPFRRGKGGPGGWIILDQPEIHLGPKPDKLVPDLAGWRRERMPSALGPSDAPAHYDVAPDWVCEIISPSTEALDRAIKMPIYRREEVKHIWFINPSTHTVEVYRYRSQERRYVVLDASVEDDGAIQAEPFEAIEIARSALWED